MSKNERNDFEQQSAKSLPTVSPVTAPSGSTVAAEAPQYSRITFEGLHAWAARQLTEGRFDELAKLSTFPIEKIVEADREKAATLMSRMTARGLAGQYGFPEKELPYAIQANIRRLLNPVARQTHDFHIMPEFDIYLQCMGCTPADSAVGFRHLSNACQQGFNSRWLLALRDKAIDLMWTPEQIPEGRVDAELLAELVADHSALLETLPDIRSTLNLAYEAAANTENLKETERTLLQILRIELDILHATPDECSEIAAKIATLPTPNLSELELCVAGDYHRSEHHLLTPREWSFLVELAQWPCETYDSLLDRYPGRFSNYVCEGLRLVLYSICLQGEAADEALIAAAEHLVHCEAETLMSIGKSLTVRTGTGTVEFYVGSHALKMPRNLEDLLETIAESVPANYQRKAELDVLANIFSAKIQFDIVEEVDIEDGLFWLCSRSTKFAFSVARTLGSFFYKAYALLEGLRLALEQEDSREIKLHQYSSPLKDGYLAIYQAQQLIKKMAEFVPLRNLLKGESLRFWHSIFGPLFQSMLVVESDFSDKVFTEQVAWLAREFEADLLATEHQFYLAYFEQVAGNFVPALKYYIIEIEKSEVVGNYVIENVQVLCRQAKRLETIDAIIGVLEPQVSASRHPHVIQRVLADARAQRESLAKQEQFEKTALTRWPALTPQARSLLGTLAIIQTYKDFTELGRYAGMDAAWAQCHYNKLIETGMIIVEESGYRINPHIEPLLERESQHALAGRIVRAQGTSAVKQVFNSQRELAIYQVMVQLCPNHLVFPNCALQSIMDYHKMKLLVPPDEFGYYLRASVDIVVVSSMTYLPMLAIEVDSIYHDTEEQQVKDHKKDHLFSAAGIPFMRLRPLGSPSKHTIRAQVGEHLDELVKTLREDFPSYRQARALLEALSTMYDTHEALNSDVAAALAPGAKGPHHH